MESLIKQVDRARSERGFLTLAATLALSSSGNIVLDPWSTLIAQAAPIGKGNVFYSNVTIEVAADSSIIIGDHNVFHSGTLLLSTSGGFVEIGNYNEFGNGGFTLKANRKGVAIRVGSNGRYINGVQVMGQTILGDGSQILGPITVQACELEGGTSYQGSDPDLRGAVLKGQGLARALRVGRGEVINGNGNFTQEMIERQAKYH